MTTTLSRRQLNRATLARQLLLERTTMPMLDAIEHLVGLQAQNPGDPYIGLWSRLHGFSPEALSSALEDRTVVRIQAMRATIHLITAADHRYLAGVSASVLERVYRSTPFAKNVTGMDVDELLATGQRLLAEAPRSRAELAAALSEHWPDVDPPSLAQTVTYLSSLVQTPPRGLWGRSGQARWAPARAWLGDDRDRAATPDDLILRYLAAFGPATVADARVWSNLTGLGEVFERIRDQLVVFADESGRELFDLPDAPRPDPDTPAPVRFLPEYDNLLLAHADRSRVLDAEIRGWVGNLMIDGFHAGHWKQIRSKDRILIEIDLPADLLERHSGEVSDEAQLLACFLGPDLDHDIVIRAG